MKTSILLLVTSLLSSACGGKVVVDPGTPTRSCASICEKTAIACGGPDGGSPDSACEESCDAFEKFASHGCSEPYSEYLRCQDEHPQSACAGEVGNECVSVTIELAECVVAECGTDPSACL